MANGVVYVGSADGNVYALSASTGAKLWSYATGSYVESSPAVANGVVYGSSDNGDAYALNASTGAKLWSYPTGRAGDCSGAVSSPTVVDGVLYVGSGVSLYAFGLGVAGTANLYLRAEPSPTPVAQGDLLTYAFPVWQPRAGRCCSRSADHLGSRGHHLRLHPDLRHAGAGHVHDSAIPGNGTNRLSRKQQHGSENHMDGAVDGESDSAIRHRDHRKRGHHGGYA